MDASRCESSSGGITKRAPASENVGPEERAKSTEPPWQRPPGRELEPAESAVTTLELGHGVEHLGSSEVGPVGVDEDEFGVGRLPE